MAWQSPPLPPRVDSPYIHPYSKLSTTATSLQLHAASQLPKKPLGSAQLMSDWRTVYTKPHSLLEKVTLKTWSIAHVVCLRFCLVSVLSIHFDYVAYLHATLSIFWLRWNRWSLTPRKKTNAIIHPWLPITATSRQRHFPLSLRWPLCRSSTVIISLKQIDLAPWDSKLDGGLFWSTIQNNSKSGIAPDFKLIRSADC